MIEFVEYVQIPIRIKARIQKNPHTGIKNMGIEDIEICLDGEEDALASDLNALKDSIISRRNDGFVEDAWDHI